MRPIQPKWRDRSYVMRPINKLALTLKDDTTDKNEQKNERQNANASAKSKELHPNAQSRHNAAHLLLPQRNSITNNFIYF